MGLGLLLNHEDFCGFYEGKSENKVLSFIATQ